MDRLPVLGKRVKGIPVWTWAMTTITAPLLTIQVLIEFYLMRTGDDPPGRRYVQD